MSCYRRWPPLKGSTSKISEFVNNQPPHNKSTFHIHNYLLFNLHNFHSMIVKGIKKPPYEDQNVSYVTGPAYQENKNVRVPIFRGML